MAKLPSSDKARQAGAIRLEFVAVLVLLLVVFGLFLQRVLVLQAGAERMVVDAEVMNLRTELLLAVASRIVRGEEGGLRGWVGRNPLLLAAVETEGLPPPRSAGGASLGTGWRWDESQQALVHRYADGEVLRLKLGKVPLETRDGWTLGGGLVLLRERSNGD